MKRLGCNSGSQPKINHIYGNDTWHILTICIKIKYFNDLSVICILHQMKFLRALTGKLGGNTVGKKNIREMKIMTLKI